MFWGREQLTAGLSAKGLTANRERVVESTGWSRLLIDSPSMHCPVGQRLADVGIYRGLTSATLSYLATD